MSSSSQNPTHGAVARSRPWLRATAHAPRLLVAHDPQRVRGRRRQAGEGVGGRDRRAVVDHDHLHRHAQLPERAAHGAPQVVGPVLGRDDQAHVGFRSLLHWLRPSHVESAAPPSGLICQGASRRVTRSARPWLSPSSRNRTTASAHDELLVAGAHPHADGVVAHVEDGRDHHRRPVGPRLAVALGPLVDPRLVHHPHVAQVLDVDRQRQPRHRLVGHVVDLDRERLVACQHLGGPAVGAGHRHPPQLDHARRPGPASSRRPAGRRRPGRRRRPRPTVRRPPPAPRRATRPEGRGAGWRRCCGSRTRPCAPTARPRPCGPGSVAGTRRRPRRAPRRPAGCRRRGARRRRTPAAGTCPTSSASPACRGTGGAR